MKRIMALLLLVTLLQPGIVGAEKELTEDCKKLLEETKAQYVNLVTNDVLTSFQLIEELSSNNSFYFTASELWKSEFLTEQDPYIDSLKKLMTGKYQGEKRLYFLNQEPSTGYILYKDIDDNNVMLTIQKKDNSWIITDEQSKEGKKIAVETTECKEQHFMQKMFDHMYP